jgi:hypothetical protein
MRRRYITLGALTIAVVTGAANHFGEKLLDLPSQLVSRWWAAEPQEPNLGREVSIQAPSDFPYKLTVGRAATGTYVEILSTFDKK